MPSTLRQAARKTVIVQFIFRLYFSYAMASLSLLDPKLLILTRMWCFAGNLSSMYCQGQANDLAEWHFSADSAKDAPQGR